MIKVRVDDAVVSLPTLKGADGKSAYQYAVEAGYKGSEEEYINLLIDGTDLINSHLTDKLAHNDIRESIDTLEAKVDSVDIDKITDITTTHNMANDAHADIRLSITELEFKVDGIDVAEEVNAGVSTHNTDENAHADIRELIESLQDDIVNSDFTEAIYDHDMDSMAHSNIRQSISTLSSKVDNIDVSTQVNTGVSTHNTDSVAHNDIRQSISALSSKVDNIDVSGDVNSGINSHNVATDAHNDIRLLITELTNRLNALADSDDDTLDQMSEIVAYIKSNKELIESVTTTKVNVSDIIDNLTTNVGDRPLSAAQGVALKGLIDTLQTAVDAKANTSDLTSHTGNTDIHVSPDDKTKWDNKAESVHTHEIADVNGLQTIADNSQFCTASLKTAGWYRFAKYNGSNEYDAKGANVNSCEIILKRNYISNSSEGFKILLKSRYLFQEFIPIFCNSLNSEQHLLNKIRYVYDSKNAFIDVYYNSNDTNSTSFFISNGKDVKTNWQTITPTLVEETTEGETVSTVFDIPANADPVNSLDLENTLNTTTQRQYQQIIDLRDTSIYDENTWYPCVGSSLPLQQTYIGVNAYLASSGVPSWATHQEGFTCNLELLVKGSGWGGTNAESICLDHSCVWVTVENEKVNNPCVYSQIHQTTQPVFWLRGGGKYYAHTQHACTWNIVTTSYDCYDYSISPTTTYPVSNFVKSTIVANLEGNASTATALTTSAGSTTKPVYFADGKPVECTMNSCVECGKVDDKTFYVDIEMPYGVCSGNLIAIQMNFGGCSIRQRLILSPSTLSTATTSWELTNICKEWAGPGNFYIVSVSVAARRGSLYSLLSSSIVRFQFVLNDSPSTYSLELTSCEAYVQGITGKAYAGSSVAGGSATSAEKLTTSAGSDTQPVYFKDGKPVAINRNRADSYEWVDENTLQINVIRETLHIGGGTLVNMDECNIFGGVLYIVRTSGPSVKLYFRVSGNNDENLAYTRWQCQNVGPQPPLIKSITFNAGTTDVNSNIQIKFDSIFNDSTIKYYYVNRAFL